MSRRNNVTAEARVREDGRISVTVRLTNFTSTSLSAEASLLANNVSISPNSRNLGRAIYNAIIKAYSKEQQNAGS